MNAALPPELYDTFVEHVVTHLPDSHRDRKATLAVLLNILGGRGWLKAEEIFQDWRWVERYGAGMKRAYAERKLRAVASASKGRVLSWPGSPGYKLTREATVAEMERAHVLKHQADEMAQRFTEIMRVYHGQAKG